VAMPRLDSSSTDTLPAVSTLWTPGGEVPVGRGPADDKKGKATPVGAKLEDSRADDEPDDVREAREAAEERVQALREQLLKTPAAVVIANHAYGLFELAAIHLSASPPNLDEARLATDAMGAVVEGLAGRLGEVESSLKDALAQIRLAFVQVSASRASAQ